MTSREMALEVTDLGRSFGGRPVVEDVTFAVAPQEVLCVLGPSGCGKSTTLRMIAGLERPDSGTIRIGGREVAGGNRFVPPEHRGIGMVFQDFALFPHLDVAANIRFGVKDSRQPCRVNELLDRVGLSGFGHKYPHELSGGEQQRVALLRALASGPSIMLMDEPFSGLDSRLRDGVRDMALDLLREAGTAVLLVTHDPAEALQISDRVAVMRGGRVIQLADPQTVYHSPADLGVAELFSQVSVVEGVVHNGQVVTHLGRGPAPGLQDGEKLNVAIRPHHVVIHQDGAQANDHAISATVQRVRFTGHESRLELVTETGQRLFASLGTEAPPPLGKSVLVSISHQQLVGTR